MSQYAHASISRVSFFISSLTTSLLWEVLSSFLTWFISDPDCSDLIDCSSFCRFKSTSVVRIGNCCPELSGSDHSVTMMWACRCSFCNNCSKLITLSFRKILSEILAEIKESLLESTDRFEVPQEKSNPIHIYNNVYFMVGQLQVSKMICIHPERRSTGRI